MCSSRHERTHTRTHTYKRTHMHTAVYLTRSSAVQYLGQSLPGSPWTVPFTPGPSSGQGSYVIGFPSHLSEKEVGNFMIQVADRYGNNQTSTCSVARNSRLSVLIRSNPLAHRQSGCFCVHSDEEGRGKQHVHVALPGGVVQPLQRLLLRRLRARRPARLLPCQRAPHRADVRAADAQSLRRGGVLGYAHSAFIAPSHCTQV